MAFTPLNKVKEVLDTMQEYLSRLMFLGEVRGSANNIRVTITDSAVPVSGTLTGVTTVTTVTTIGNQSQIGGYNANMQVQNMQNIEASIGNIDNLIVN